MTGARECDWCGGSLAGRKPETTTCTDSCRITLSKWRRGIGPFAPGGSGHDQRGRRRPHDPAVAREHHGRDVKRAARARGRIKSDQRVQLSTAVEVAVTCMRQTSAVREADARAIAVSEFAKRARGRGGRG